MVRELGRGRWWSVMVIIIIEPGLWARELI